MDLETLRARQSRIFSTDIVRLVGLGYDDEGVDEVWADKTGEPIQRPASIRMRMGLATENLNAELYAEKTGRPCHKLFGLFESPTYPFAGTSLDWGTGCGRIVELKHIERKDDDWGDQWSDRIPPRVICQTTWQAGVYGAKVVDVSALFGMSSHSVYEVPFDPRLFSLLLDVARDFMGYVARGEAPGSDWVHPLAPEIERHIEAVVPGKTVALGPDAADMAAAYKRMKAIEKDARAEAKAAYENLGRLIGDAERATADGWKFTRSFIASGEVSYRREAYTRITITPPKALKGVK